MKFAAALGALSAVAVLLPNVGAAQQYGSQQPYGAQPYGQPAPPPPEHHYHHHYHHHYRESCGQTQHDRAVLGTVAGAAGGAILGSAIGGHAPGILLGAGAGALAGHAIARHTGPCS